MTNQLPRVHEIEHHDAERVTTRPVVSGTQGVVSAGHPLVSMAGMRMLLAGGRCSRSGRGGRGPSHGDDLYGAEERYRILGGRGRQSADAEEADTGQSREST